MSKPANPYTVLVHMKDAAAPLQYTDAVNTYEKGSFFCVMTAERKVFKHLTRNIWRVTELPAP